MVPGHMEALGKIFNLKTAVKMNMNEMHTLIN